MPNEAADSQRSGDTLARAAQAVLREALDVAPAERDAFLDRACGDQPELRDEVESLLAAHASAGTFLEKPALGTREPARSDATAAPLIGRRVGQYTVREVIAEGGMGTVYLAEQAQPKRDVALKVMRMSLPSNTAIARFKDEAHILARLDHPGIAQVYEAGTYEHAAGISGLPFFAMEYVADGAPITDWVDRQALSVEDRLRLFIEVCDAVHHGHQKSIIHRDLKPPNILVDAGGRPKVIDFGVARIADADPNATAARTIEGQLVGTLAYMSPEQCEADPEKIDIRTDVYALGVVLYEMLCGRRPHQIEQMPVDEAFRAIRRDPPTRPSTLERGVRGDLERIILKCLEKEAHRRYGSCAELRRDVERYLDGRPIEARSATFFYTARLFARRNRTVVLTVSTIAVALAAATIISIAFALRANREADDRASAEKNALDERDFAIRQRYLANVATAEAAYRAGDYLRMKRALNDAPLEHRGWGWSYLNAQAFPELFVLTEPNLLISGAFVGGGENVLAGNLARGLTSWSLADPKVRHHTPPMATASAIHAEVMAGSPDHTKFAVGWTTGVLDIHAADGTKLQSIKAHHEYVSAIAWSPDSSMVLTGGWDDIARLWNAETGEMIREMTDHTHHVGGAAFSRDGTWFVTGGEEGALYRYMLDGGGADPFLVPPGPVQGISISPDGERLAVGCTDGTLALWHLVDGASWSRPDAHDDMIDDVKFYDDDTIVTASRDSTIGVFDAASGDTLRTFGTHARAACSVDVDPERGRILSVALDGTARIWSIDGADSIRILAPSSSRALLAAVDGARVLTARGSELRCFGLATGRPLGERITHPLSRIQAGAISPDGRLVALADATGGCVIMNSITGELVHRIEQQSGVIWTVAFDPSGALLACAPSEGDIAVFSVETGERLGVVPHPRVRTLAISYDGNYLITAGGNNTPISIWRMSDFQLERRAALGQTDVYALAVDPVSGLVASGGQDGSIALFDIHDVEDSLRILDGMENVLTTLAFSPDGARLVSGSRGMHLSVWDVESGDELVQLNGHAGQIRVATFVPDGGRILSASADGDLRVWDTMRFADRLAEREAVLAALEDAGTLVDELFQTHGDWAIVIDTLVADGDLDHTLKMAAIEVAADRAFRRP